ncbi:MAG TPA: GIDE domain-containing protein [bacterium]|nr:GIDE domain-containing protein [bacterium]
MNGTDPVVLMVLAGLAVLGGIFLFFRGFRDLKRKRLIEDTPTSTIRAMAPGLVEVTGTGVQHKPLNGPFTQRACLYYEYLVEEQRERTVGSGKDQHTETYWATIKSEDTSELPFLVDDGTGKALVRPEGAEMVLVDRWELQPGIFGDIPAPIVDFLKTRGVDCYGLFGFKRPLRFTERILAEGQKLYLLATCRTAGEGAEGMHLVKSPHGDPFIVSAKDQKSLESSLGWAAFFLIPLGILLTGGGIYGLVTLWTAR